MIDDVVLHQQHAYATHLIPCGRVDRIETSRGASDTAALFGAERARHHGEHRRWAGRLDEEQTEPKPAQSSVCFLGIGMGSRHHYAIGRDAGIPACELEQVPCVGTVQAPIEKNQIDRPASASAPKPKARLLGTSHTGDRQSGVHQCVHH